MATINRSLRVLPESQHDNESGQGWRECFSSSAACLARFYGKVQGDDAYNKVRRRFGDTTNPQAQVQALRALGLVPRFVTNAGPETIRQEINAGRPLAVGWIHKGPLPDGLRGDGHWSVVCGFNDYGVLHMDPNGEADMVRGGYVHTRGGCLVTYSWQNWRRRWEVVEARGGWRFAPGNGWALLVRP